VTPAQGGLKGLILIGISGQSYVVLTTWKDNGNDETVTVGSAIITVGH
jgi:hypothetical protein